MMLRCLYALGRNGDIEGVNDVCHEQLFYDSWSLYSYIQGYIRWFIARFVIYFAALLPVEDVNEYLKP